MAVPNTFSAGTLAKSAEVNENFAWAAGPIGTVQSWLKSYTNTPTLPDSWVECNGQTLSDGDSVYDGQVIPDLNGDNRFLRGNSTSGGTGGSETHTHSIATTTSGLSGGTGYSVSTTNVTGSTSTLPTYYEIVYIMRVK